MLHKTDDPLIEVKLVWHRPLYLATTDLPTCCTHLHCQHLICSQASSCINIAPRFASGTLVIPRVLTFRSVPNYMPVIFSALLLDLPI